nr:MAG TPA: helix-turn-helix domain protein [Caudoviricetes sp.]
MPNTERLKRRMAELGYTQSELAKEIGVATPTICQKINNSRPFSLDEAEKIASILKIKDKDFGSYFFDS